MVQTSGAIGPDYGQLRVLAEGKGPFPIVPDLVDRLVEPGPQPDETIARVLGTCAGYAYSDQDTVAPVGSLLFGADFPRRV